MKMSLPSRDFRALLIEYRSNPNKINSEQLILSASREPLTELLSYWKSSNKPKKEYDIYSEAIKKAATKNRYPAFLIDRINDYPEFACAFREGLEKYLYRLRFSYNPETNTLHIDELPGVGVELDNATKTYIFRVSYKDIVGLNLNTRDLSKVTYMYMSFSKQTALLLEKYRLLAALTDFCDNVCSKNINFC